MSTGSRGGGVYMRAKGRAISGLGETGGRGWTEESGGKRSWANETLATSKTKRSYAGIITGRYPDEACPDEGESKRCKRCVWVGVEQFGCVTFQSSAVFGEQRRSLVVTLGTDRGLAGSECGYECERE